MIVTVLACGRGEGEWGEGKGGGGGVCVWGVSSPAENCPRPAR